MDNEKSSGRRREYHPAYCNAAELELAANRDELVFEREVTLNRLPREIDLLIIKKIGDVQIESELGKIFKRYNIWELKSPHDSLGVKVYFKVLSYAYQYLSENETLSDISEITITFLRESRPRDLMKWFRDKGFKEEKRANGLYRYTKEGHPDMQLVIISEPGISPWFRIMTDSAEAGDIRKVEKLMSGLPRELREKTQAVWDLAYENENFGELVKEVKDMAGIRDLFQEEFDEKDRQIAERDAMIEQKDATIEQQGAVLEQQGAALEQKDAALEQLRKENLELRTRLGVAMA